MSVVPDTAFGASGVVHYTDGLPPTTQYDQIVSATSATSITTVAEVSDLNAMIENQLIVRRFISSGASINANTITLPFDASSALTITDVALDAGNNTYVAGSRFDPDTNATVGFVIRVNSSGTLDNAFGAGTGYLATGELAANSQNVQLAVSGGLIYAAYVTADQITPSIRTANILSFDPSGSTNIAYGIAGTSARLLPQDGATVNELLTDGSGLLLVGTTFVGDNDGNTPDPESIYVGRIDGAGVADVGFGANGFGVSAPTGFSTLSLSGVARVATGFVVAGSTLEGNQVVIKLNSNQQLDPSFAGGGVATLAAPFTLSPLDRSTRSITADAAGNLYATGITVGDDSADLAVVRLTSSGALDGSFANGGVYSLDEAEADIGIGIAKTSTNAILVTGSQVDGITGEQNGVFVQLAEPVVINNPPVVASVATAGSVNTGVSTTFTSSFSDVDAGDSFTVSWNFGDGSGPTAPVATGEGTVSAAHVYTVAGMYTVTVTISDGVNPPVSNIGTITVTTPPPPVPYTIVGGQLALTGNAGADNVELVKSGANYILTVNGTPYTINSSLNSAIIYGGNGADFIRVSAQITIPVSLIGGSGNDTLRGGSGNDVILGDEGNDLIIGRDGQDLMIGGTGADFLIGREDADLLISGTTTLSSNLAALSAIQAEWTSNHNILIKLANVTGLLPLPGRLNGNFYLTPEVTVFSDNSVDTLSGGDGADLYYITLFGLNADIIRDNQTNFAASIAALVFGD